MLKAFTYPYGMTALGLCLGLGLGLGLSHAVTPVSAQVAATPPAAATASENLAVEAGSETELGQGGDTGPLIVLSAREGARADEDTGLSLGADMSPELQALRNAMVAMIDALEQSAGVMDAISAYQGRLIEAARARPEILLERPDLSALCESDPFDICAELPFTLGTGLEL